MHMLRMPQSRMARRTSQKNTAGGTAYRKLPFNEVGTLYEIPLLLIGYSVLCALFLPDDYPIRLWTVAVFMFIGLAVSFLLSSTISIDRFRLWKIPACLWSFLLLSALTVPFTVWIEHRTITVAVLIGQTFLSFYLDLQLSAWRVKRAGPGLRPSR